jgi:hypothetical protein
MLPKFTSLLLVALTACAAATEISPITNQGIEAQPIATRHFRVFTGVPGAAYNHHHQITSLNGVLYASWSNGYASEDHPGQRMMMATSSDGGETWTDARPIRDRIQGKYAEAVVTAMGIRPYQGKLVAYYGVYEYPPERLIAGTHPTERKEMKPFEVPPAGLGTFGERTEIIVSEDAGKTWSKPVGGIDGFVPNLKPKEVKGGRLIMTGNLMFPYTDSPDGISGWVRTGIAGLAPDYVDAPERFQTEALRLKLPAVYCEAAFYQRDDRVIHMLLRSEDKPGYLGVSESRDNGVSWSRPIPSGFKVERNRFDCGRLPDGRFFVVCAPEAWRRPLVIDTSADGITFNHRYILGDAPRATPRIPGGNKGGTYGYPSYHILGDRMYVIYSVSKEDIEVCRFDLSQLN